jgi:hypothetical protein
MVTPVPFAAHVAGAALFDTGAISGTTTISMTLPAAIATQQDPQEGEEPSLTPNAPDVARWAAGFGPMGVNNTVYALAVGRDGSPYAGGAFGVAGNTLASHIARWDGTAWRALGSGVAGTDSPPAVNALAFGPDGSLYAGGLFTAAGGVPANYVARWDGSTWHALGSGMGGPSYPAPRVYSLAVGTGGLLYAGGLFTTAGGTPAAYIARWDGTAWHALGSGLVGCGFMCALSLAVGRDGSLYAGGTFTMAGGRPSSAIAKWIGEAGRRTMLPLVPHSH